jgi:hypothetical protein
MVRKTEGKRPLGRPIRRWVHNRKMEFGEIGWGDWIGLVQDRDKWRTILNAVMNLRAPYNVCKLWSSFKLGGLLSSAQLHRVSCLVSQWGVKCGGHVYQEKNKNVM